MVTKTRQQIHVQYNFSIFKHILGVEMAKTSRQMWTLSKFNIMDYIFKFKISAIFDTKEILIKHLNRNLSMFCATFFLGLSINVLKAIGYQYLIAFYTSFSMGAI